MCFGSPVEVVERRAVSAANGNPTRNCYNQSHMRSIPGAIVVCAGAVLLAGQGYGFDGAADHGLSGQIKMVVGLILCVLGVLAPAGGLADRSYRVPLIGLQLVTRDLIWLLGIAALLAGWSLDHWSYAEFHRYAFGGGGF